MTTVPLNCKTLLSSLVRLLAGFNAYVLGAELVSQDLNMKLEDMTLRQLGKANNITVTANDTLILGGGGEKADIDARCNQIRQRISESDSAYETEKLQERLAKLAGGVAQIRVRNFPSTILTLTRLEVPAKLRLERRRIVSSMLLTPPRPPLRRVLFLEEEQLSCMPAVLWKT